ncbi:histidine kinase [Pararhodospirillum oryzae]|uniref:histidine kinase n=1 Tax=Pararhodospirillum oryzae TaxID=478448 RepID=A0A512H6K4_9PROT|nr:histidine kinase [Pararhodospirillum oryzae]
MGARVSVQPQGILLVVEPGDETILHASIPLNLGTGRKSVLGEALGSVLEAEDARRCLERARANEPPFLIDPLVVRDRQGRVFEALAHRAGRRVVVELFETPPRPLGEDVLGRLTVALGQVARVATLEALCAHAARTLADLTGYDRVMIHRFTEAWDGDVVAEVCRGGMASFLGRRFPGLGHAPEARARLERLSVRAIPDVGYRPQRLEGRGSRVDLGGCLLRGVSPGLRAALEALGARASLAVAIVVEGRLWGMVVCHHGEPRPLPPSIMGAAQVFTEMVGQQIVRLDSEARAHSRARVSAVMEGVAGRLAEGAGMAEALRAALPDLRALFGAGAAVLSLDGRQASADGPLDGAPVEVDPAQKVLVSERVPEGVVLPPALARGFAGVVLLPLSDAPDKDFMVLGREEASCLIRWVDPRGRQALPPAGLEAWDEEVRGCSRPFTALDEEAAVALQLFLAERLGEVRRREAEDALEESQLRLRHLAECSSDWFWETDAQGRLTTVSDLLKGLGDLRAAELIGHPLTLLLGAPDDPGEGSEVEDIESALARGHAFHGLTALLRVAGRGQWWVRLSGVPLLGAAGELLGFRGTGTNVTPLKALQEERLRAQRLEALGRMASGIAHEINNVLQPMLTMSYYAGKRVEDTAFVRQALADIEESGLRAREIVRAILAFARQAPSRRQPLTIARDLGRAIEFARKGLPQLRVFTDIEETSVQVLANETELSQIVLNLLANANDAMDGRGIVHVGLRTQPDVGRVRITVRDEGPGMDLDIRDRIFDPFFTTKPEGRGTGMGLAVVHGLVEAWGGTIGVESAPGMGTIFWISLPVTTATALKTSQAEP